MKKAYMTNIISLLLVNFFDFGQNINQTCQVKIDTRYFSTEGQGQFFSKFGKFSDILLDCNQTYNASEHIYIEPSIELLIDNSFQIGKLFKEDQFNLIKDINLGNIKGIDVQSKFIESSIETFILASFRFSKLDVYLNEKILNSSQCNTKIYNNLNNFFQYFVAIVFSQVRYPKNELCPLIFLNSISKQFIFEDIINSYLTKNRLIFSKLNVSEDFDMGIRRIYMVTLFLYYENLSANNMDNHLFKRVIELKIFRTIENIEVGLLRNFKSLKNIDFQIDNFREFFQQGNAWFNDLNTNIILDLNNSDPSSKINPNYIMKIRFKYQTASTSFDIYYEYLDEDLCLFKNFPHSRAVYAVLDPGKSLKCTCTLAWLQFYYELYEPFINPVYNSTDSEIPDIYQLASVKKTSKYCSNEEVKSLNCDFETKFKNCDSHKTISKSKGLSFTNDIDIYFIVKWLQFILLTILQPIFSFLGLFNNILTIICIKNGNKKKDLKDPMYKHILINCLYNSVYCIIMMLKLINTCIFPYNSVFCSSVYQSESAQYFKIVLIIYFGNVMKMCSNISYISFSFSRFILVSNLKEKKIFKTFNNIRLPVYFVVLFVSSCMINIFTLFQYTLNIPSLISRLDFPYEIRNEEFCENELHKFECSAFNALKISSRFLNDILSVIIILVIDLFLLKNFHKHLEDKSTVLHDTENKLIIQKSKKNANRMIIATNIIYFLAHMPEFIINILHISYFKKISKFCQKISCDILNEEAQFFSLISIVCQFYIFVKFKRSFKSSLSDLFARYFAHKPKISPNNTSQLYSIELRNLNLLIGDGKIG
jgi:hypothetical protein